MFRQAALTALVVVCVGVASVFAAWSILGEVQHDAAVALEVRRKIVINLGLPKTGTTSLHDALALAGHTNYHYNCKEIRAGRDEYFVKKYGFDFRTSKDACSSSSRCGGLIVEAVERGFEPFEFFRRTSTKELFSLTQMDCASPKKLYFPQATFLESFFQRYPDAIYVLTTRSTERWLESLSKWHGIGRRIDKHIRGKTIHGHTFPSQGNWRTVLADFKAWHETRVRLLSSRDPSLKLYELDLEDQNKTLENFKQLLAELGLDVPSKLESSYLLSNKNRQTRKPTQS